MSSLKDIADQLGIAVSTVSRALAGKPGVSAEKRAEILALCRKLGVAPNPAASRLRTGKGGGLSIITQLKPTEITTLRNYALFARGRERFGTVHVIIHEESRTLEETVIAALTPGPTAVCISGLSGTLSPRLCDRLKRERIPLLVIDGLVPDVDSVLLNRVQGMFQAASLFILNGYRNIVWWTYSGLDAPDDRIRGITAAYDTLGIPRDRIRTLSLDQTEFSDGYRLAKETLSSTAVDALFCYNDVMAASTLRVLAEKQIAVPGEVAVIGFDNIPLAAYCTTPLTTVAQPVEDSVDAAMELLERRMKQADAPPFQKILPTRLIVRESCPIAQAEYRERIFTDLPVMQDVSPISNTF